MPKKTVGFFAVVVLGLGGVLPPHVAQAATCSSGYYLDGDTCRVCAPSAGSFYCPGDDMRYPCPTTNTDYNQFGYTLIDGSEAFWASPETNSVPGNCVGSLYFVDSYGNAFLLESPWNGENYWSDDKDTYLWYYAAPGFYLSNYRSESWEKWYRAVKPCTNAPAYAHYTAPGTADAPDGSVTDANDCPWACDDGYGRVGNVCQPLCTAGLTQIHAGSATVPLFPVKYTSPTLVVHTDGGLCYGNLWPGTGLGINIRITDTTYHLE